MLTYLTVIDTPTLADHMSIQSEARSHFWTFQVVWCCKWNFLG